MTVRVKREVRETCRGFDQGEVRAWQERRIAELREAGARSVYAGPVLGVAEVASDDWDEREGYGPAFDAGRYAVGYEATIDFVEDGR